jgi:aminoglycoside phosphotransferase (APT) family kinase protein
LRRGGSPEREAALMQLAREHGYPVPRVDDVRADGLVMERVAGPTMGQDLQRRPWRARRHMATLAELHARLHAIPHGGATLVHYDLHPANVLLSPAGPVVIDWTNGRAGDPDADVALSWLILATSAGMPGRLLAWLFARRAGADVIARGLPAARAFRVADPNVSPAERERARVASV